MKSTIAYLSLTILLIFSGYSSGNTDSYSEKEEMPPFEEYVEERDLDSIVEHLKNPSPVVRVAAYDALLDWELDEIEVYLIEGLGDYDTDVRWKIATILDQKGWEPRNKVHKVRYALAKKDWDTAVSFGREGEVQVLRILQNGDVEVRKGLVVAMGESGNLRYYDTLKHIYRHDENQDVRYLAFEAMNELGEKTLEDEEGWLSRRMLMVIVVIISGIVITVLFIIGLRKTKKGSV